jgi:purine-binding chemotaxis protein CheW
MPNLARIQHRGVQRLHDVRHGAIREFLVFVVNDELYGVELVKVKEILTPPPITLVPRAPREVIGVCSVRGLLVTVVDLRLRLGGRKASQGRRTRILLTEVAGEIMGLMVDEVRQVMRLTESEIELANAAFGADVADHVVGVCRPAGTIVILLDLAAAVA